MKEERDGKKEGGKNREGEEERGIRGVMQHRSAIISAAIQLQSASVAPSE